MQDSSPYFYSIVNCKLFVNISFFLSQKSENVGSKVKGYVCSVAQLQFLSKAGKIREPQVQFEKTPDQGGFKISKHGIDALQIEI